MLALPPIIALGSLPLTDPSPHNSPHVHINNPKRTPEIVFIVALSAPPQKKDKSFLASTPINSVIRLGQTIIPPRKEMVVIFFNALRSVDEPH